MCLLISGNCLILVILLMISFFHDVISFAGWFQITAFSSLGGGINFTHELSKAHGISSKSMIRGILCSYDKPTLRRKFSVTWRVSIILIVVGEKLAAWCVKGVRGRSDGAPPRNSGSTGLISSFATHKLQTAGQTLPRFLLSCNEREENLRPVLSSKVVNQLQCDQKDKDI